MNIKEHTCCWDTIIIVIIVIIIILQFKSISYCLAFIAVPCFLHAALYLTVEEHLLALQCMDISFLPT